MVSLTYQTGAYNRRNETIKLKLIGVEEHETGIFLSSRMYDSLYDKIVAMSEWLYPSVLIGINGDKKDAINLLNNIENLDYIHNTDFSEMLTTSSKFFKDSRSIIIVMSLIIVIFSCLLVYSITKATILDRKKDVGILRSLGVSKFDVSKIFVLQSIAISILTNIFSILISSSFINIVNNIFSAEYAGNVTILFNSSFSICLLIIANIIFVNLFCLLALVKYLIKVPIETINE